MATLLPVTDRVGFCRPLGGARFAVVADAEWARVRRVVGHLMAPVAGLYPRRFQVEAFPTADELAELGLGDLPLGPVGEASS